VAHLTCAWKGREDQAEFHYCNAVSVQEFYSGNYITHSKDGIWDHRLEKGGSYPFPILSCATIPLRR